MMNFFSSSGKARTQFPAFSSHLDLAHGLWAKVVSPGDILIDATCGNGHDTCFLVQLKAQKVYSIDIQSKALAEAERMAKEYLSEPEQAAIQWILGSHEVFPAEISPASVKLIVYNLGYLPGGDKSLVTRTETTLKSLQKAQDLIMQGGCISITCYPGHAEGACEEKVLLDYASALNPKEWSCCHHRWLNRQHAPSLLFIQRSIKA